jgi:hypothetical protein
VVAARALPAGAFPAEITTVPELLSVTVGSPLLTHYRWRKLADGRALIRMESESRSVAWEALRIGKGAMA